MQCVCDKTGEATVIKVSGRLNAAFAPEFDQECGKWIDEEGTYLVLDLEELDYISSAGLRCILMVAKRLKAKGGKLAMCGLQGMVEEVVNLSGFAAYIPIFPSVPEAL